MNVSQCLDLLMSRLGNRTEAELRATCLLEMRLFQETKCEGGATLPWFILTETATASTEVDERRVALPDDFLREKQEQPIYLVTASGGKVKLAKKSYEELVDYYDTSEDTDEASGQPEMYAIEGGYIHLFPTPDAVYSLKFKYLAKQESPTDTPASENMWFKHVPDLMIAGAGVTVAGQHVRDPELVEIFAAQEAAARQRLIILETARDEANREREMG